jgi:hypothetical protein
MKTQEEKDAFLASLPVPPSGLKVVKLDSIPDGIDHFFTIGPRHVGWAADKFCGILGESAIEDAEKHGIHCAHPHCRVPFAKHKTMLTLFISVPRNKDLNGVPGLKEYLWQIKEPCTNFGVQGFAFPEVAG